jgi:phosphonoacetaldehyde hydrolase
VTSDEVLRGRPAPFMIHRNQELTDVYHHLAILKVGDTPLDIAEGKWSSNWTCGLSLYSSLMGLSEPEVHEMKAYHPAEFHEKHKEVRQMLYRSGSDFVVNTVNELPLGISRHVCLHDHIMFVWCLILFLFFS